MGVSCSNSYGKCHDEPSGVADVMSVSSEFSVSMLSSRAITSQYVSSPDDPERFFFFFLFSFNHFRPLPLWDPLALLRSEWNGLSEPLDRSDDYSIGLLLKQSRTDRFTLFVFSEPSSSSNSSSAACRMNQLPKIRVGDRSSKSERIVLRGRPRRAPRGPTCAGFELWVCVWSENLLLCPTVCSGTSPPRPYGKPQCSLVARLGWPSWLKLF